MTAKDSPPPPDPGITPAAKVGIATAAAFVVVCLFSMGLWGWWRRRQKRQLAKDMVNFVDGDIVNLVDGGRFEKPSTYKPTNGSYDPYCGSSSHAGTPSPVYYQAPTHFTEPPVDSYGEYYAPVASRPTVSAPSLPPSRDMPLPPQNISPSSEHVQPIPPPPPPAPVADNTGNAWSNTGRHPWSPPDYEAHVPMSATSMQADHDFTAAPRPFQSWHNEESQGPQPVAALPAILPEARPVPQAELPAREGHHGWGYEQELDAQQQPPMRRQAPPQGNDMEEQKFLLADVMALRQQKTRINMPQEGPSG